MDKILSGPIQKLQNDFIQGSNLYFLHFGQFFSVRHNWDTMRNGIQDYIASLNWNYRVQLRNKNVTYMNSYGEFQDAHTLKVCCNFMIALR